MRALFIDPSVNNVGWAVINTRAQTKEKAWKWGTIHPEGGNLEMRMFDLIQKLEVDVVPAGFKFLVTEKPAFFSSERGQIAAHQNYTIDLAAISYYIAGWYQMDHRHHYAITATMWKGQVNKDITARRFFRRFRHVDRSTLSEHAIDACMLGVFWIENFAIHSPLVALDISPEELLLLV